MRPREIEVYIDELVLHGFASETRWGVAEGLERQLHALLVEQGIPQAWQASPDRIEAGATPTGAQTKPAATGGQIARAVYRGGAR